jgi:hypothetical protein
MLAPTSIEREKQIQTFEAQSMQALNTVTKVRIYFVLFCFIFLFFCITVLL